MKKIFISIILSVILISCNKKKSENTIESLTNSTDTIVAITKNIKPFAITDSSYFKGNGTEPFWSLSISENMIKLKTLKDSLFTPHTDPILAADSNVKLYKLETELAKMTIQISQKDCINTASGLTSPYTVTISYKEGSENDFSKLEGCGSYITDYRLHDIWILESLNNSIVSKDDFGKDLPSLEINSSANTFSGSTGCNRMTGQLFFEYNKLRFTSTAVTEMLCSKSENEQAFLNALKATTNYSIGKNRLSLSNSNGTLLLFKKVD